MFCLICCWTTTAVYGRFFYFFKVANFRGIVGRRGPRPPANFFIGTIIHRVPATGEASPGRGRKCSRARNQAPSHENCRYPNLSAPVYSIGHSPDATLRAVEAEDRRYPILSTGWGPAEYSLHSECRGPASSRPTPTPFPQDLSTTLGSRPLRHYK